jgi:transcriptional regulator with XRE-family HTH domain
MNIGERIKNRRLELNLSQDELAHKVGYKSRSSINKIELSRSLPLSKVQKMADALETTPGYLMGWTSEIQNSKPKDDSREKLYIKLSQLNKDGLKEAESYIDYLLSKKQYIKTSSEMVSGE